MQKPCWKEPTSKSKDILEQLGAKCGNGACHLDPDIRYGIVNVPADWQPAFGQQGAAQSILKKHVKEGDLFLFFGWFKQTELKTDGKLKFKRGAKDLHIIYGYLQVGKIVSGKEIQKYDWHPHTDMDSANNCLYVPRDTLSWDGNFSGYGVLSYNKSLVLTKDGMSRSCWKLPDLPAFSTKPAITGSYEDAWRSEPLNGNYYRAMDIGQEFVIEENEEVAAWAKALITG